MNQASLYIMSDVYSMLIIEILKHLKKQVKKDNYVIDFIIQTKSLLDLYCRIYPFHLLKNVWFN